MRRKRAVKRGRWVSVLTAAGIGFLLGTWTARAVHSSGPAQDAPAQTVAQRFPHDAGLAPAPQPMAARYAAAATGALASGAQGALFDPEPMMPHPAPAKPAVRLAEVETASPASPAPAAPVAAKSSAIPIPMPRPMPTAHEPASRKAVAAPTRHFAERHFAERHVERHGLILDDAQIASIRRRLNLTPEQRRMWPPVAVALRNIGRAREHNRRRDGRPGSVDPNSAEVQNLKYAALPLLMSFNERQKDEVRSLARHMGLNRLAAEL